VDVCDITGNFVRKTQGTSLGVKIDDKEGVASVLVANLEADPVVTTAFRNRF